jgi:hypothetical protein
MLQKSIDSLPSLGFSHPNMRQFIQHRLIGLLVHRCKTFVREGREGLELRGCYGLGSRCCRRLGVLQ